MKKYTVAIAAAGTAGHVNPGIAIANKIKKKRDDVDIIFIGTERGIEGDLVEKAGYDLKLIKAYGFAISPTPVNIKRQFINLFLSKGMAKKVLKENNVDLVIGTGGYITYAVGRAAKSLNIPIVFHESNAYPGLAIRAQNKKANKILIGFENSKEFFKYQDNVKFVGNPISITKKEINKEEVFDKLGLLPNKKTILVFGGSQGARQINNAVVPLIIKDFFKNEDFQLIFATGKNNYEGIKENLKENGKHINNIENVKIFPYIYNMEEILNSVDIAVTRAGAITVSEILEVMLPTIFIPLPSQKANRQIDNAKLLEKNGGAEIILNEELNSEVLEQKLLFILNNEDKLSVMRKNIEANREENHALDKIYDEIKEYIEEK